MSDQAAAPVVDEALYQQSLQELKSPRPWTMSSLLFSILMVVFVAGLFFDLRSVTGVLLLVAAVAFHEAGHALGMRLFGFRDIQMFFIPFFGAAVSGHQRGAAAWKEAVVSLLGPLPGLLLGLALVVGTTVQPYPSALAIRLASALLWLNAFNLMPLGFLDGGRFLERLLFSRHRVLEVSFRAVGYLVLALVAFRFAMPMLGVFAALSMLGLPSHWKLLTEAATLRKQYPSIDPDPERIGEAESRALFFAAQTSVSVQSSERPADLARAMESILVTTRRAPRLLATLGLLVVYALALAVTVFGIIGLSFQDGPVEWKKVGGPGWHAEFPRAPIESPASSSAPVGAPTARWSTVVGGAERFSVEVTAGAEDGAWMEARVDTLARVAHLERVRVRPVAFGDHTGAEYELAVPQRVMRARLVAVDGTRYIVTASAPKWGENQRRFLESFALGDSTTRR
jgi:Zn-dependent protease